MNNNPEVSVILPTYNQAQFLPTALDGIAAQTFRDFELIVVNDGSTDDTSRLLAEYSERTGCHVVEQSNQGLPRALNVGFTHAKGRYLTWTSSDNVMLPAMLRELVSALDHEPAIGVVYGDWHFMDDNGRVTDAFRTLDYDRYLLLRHNYVHCCFLFRRECLDSVGGYRPDFVYSEDWDFWIRVSRRFGMKRVPQALYLYRLHGSSMTGDIQRGTASRVYGYREFAAHLRREEPIGWFYSKVKWQLMKLRTGRDPRREWQKVVDRMCER